MFEIDACSIGTKPITEPQTEVEQVADNTQENIARQVAFQTLRSRYDRDEATQDVTRGGTKIRETVMWVQQDGRGERHCCTVQAGHRRSSTLRGQRN